MYIIVKGEVGVYFDGLSDKIITRLGACEIFGEKALISERKTREVTIKALQDTTCLCLDKKDFLDRVFFFEHK